MAYQVIYDIRQEPPFDTGAAWLALGFITTGIIWSLIRRSRDRKKAVPPVRTGWSTPKVFIIFGSAIAVIGIGLMGWDHWRLVKAIDNGEAGIVEGPIQSWGIERVRTANTKKIEYNIYERFYVGDSIWFGYYQNVGQAGFHNTARVELRDGMWVRATYLYADGADDPPRIVKLERREPGP